MNVKKNRGQRKCDWRVRASEKQASIESVRGKLASRSGTPIVYSFPLPVTLKSKS